MALSLFPAFHWLKTSHTAMPEFTNRGIYTLPKGRETKSCLVAPNKPAPLTHFPEFMTLRKGWYSLNYFTNRYDHMTVLFLIEQWKYSMKLLPHFLKENCLPYTCFPLPTASSTFYNKEKQKTLWWNNKMWRLWISE